MAVRFSQYSSYIDVLAELVIAIVLHKPFCPILGQYEHLILEVLLDFPKKCRF